MSTITILGAGMMGSAWCLPLIDAGHSVRLVGTHLDEAIIAQLKQNRHHLKLNYSLPDAVQPFQLSELGEAMAGCEIVGLGVSSQGVRWAARTLAPWLSSQPVMMISKGLEWQAGQLQILPDIFSQELALLGPQLKPSAPCFAPVGVAGPCIAGELARRVETCVVMTGRNPELVKQLARAVRTPYYHAFASPDAVGVETCAALKNAYAMAIAFAVGLHRASGGEAGSIAMHNHESAVFAQAVVEMQRIVEWLGGDSSSAVGLAGVGDLDVTCNGGRTGRFGALLGSGLNREQAVEAMQGATLECLDILATMKQAVDSAGSGAGGELSWQRVPLLQHMVEVVAANAPVNVPFPRFFGGLEL